MIFCIKEGLIHRYFTDQFWATKVVKVVRYAQDVSNRTDLVFLFLAVIVALLSVCGDLILNLGTRLLQTLSLSCMFNVTHDTKSYQLNLYYNDFPI